MQFYGNLLFGMLAIAASAPSPALAYTPTFTDADFTLTPVFNSITSFSFTIDIAAALAPGSYVNPTLNSVQYSVQGVLGGTPSGFPAFNLVRNITGADFYAQGSSLSFVIGGGANLADGLQISDLAGPNPVFVFDGREVNTGRYHPLLIQLNGDGTGSIRNSNNFGGINLATMQMVNVNYGEEYIVNLGFNPAAATIVTPEPGSLLSLGAGLIALLALGKQRV